MTFWLLRFAPYKHAFRVLSVFFSSWLHLTAFLTFFFFLIGVVLSDIYFVFPSTSLPHHNRLPQPNNKTCIFFFYTKKSGGQVNFFPCLLGFIIGCVIFLLGWAIILLYFILDHGIPKKFNFHILSVFALSFSVLSVTSFLLSKTP